MKKKKKKAIQVLHKGSDNETNLILAQRQASPVFLTSDSASCA